MPAKKYTILILFYSFTGQTAKLLKYIEEGALMIPNTQVSIRRIPELIPDTLFAQKPKLGIVKKQLEKTYQAATVDDLISADGIILGSPVHFGSMAGQVKMFLDQFSPIWTKNALANKPFSVFCTGGSLHAGEELTLYTMMLPFLWLGMIPVGIPYPLHNVHDDFDSGSPLGAIFTSGHNGEKRLSTDDKKVARILGGRLAAMAQVINCQCSVALNAMKKFEQL